MARRAMSVMVALACALPACDRDREPGPATALAPPGVAPSTTLTADSAVTPQGFARVQARVTAADGEVCELCVWLADQPDLRRRGLMGVTDLGDAAAMAFEYQRPTSTSFWMRDTPLPLSIAFFDAEGAFLDSFDMAPCATSTCPHYRTPAQFTVAVEVPEGGLDELLMVPGSTLELLDAACP